MARICHETVPIVRLSEALVMAHAPRYGDTRSPPMKAFLSMQVDWKRIGQSTARRSAVHVGLELSVCHRSQDISSSNWRKFFKADGFSRGNPSALNGVLVQMPRNPVLKWIRATP